MDIRPYLPQDRDACLAIAQSLPGESLTAEFLKFLDAGPGPSFFVAEHEGQLLACGGFHQEAGGAAWLQWGMVHRDWQRKGIGKFLLFFRLRELGKLNTPLVFVTPAADATGFYEKFGFRADGVRMVKRLEVCG